MSRIFRSVSNLLQKQKSLASVSVSNSTCVLSPQSPQPSFSLSPRWASTATSALQESLEERKTPSGGKYYVKNIPLEASAGNYVEPSVKELLESDEALRHPDYFQVHKLFTVKDLFDARVHLGHKIGSLEPRMADFVFGTRFDTCIIDLDKTAFHLRQALNFVAHVAYRKGIILFITRSPHMMQLVETTAVECGEYAHCREWDIHTFTNSERKFGGITRLPDAVILLNTLDTVMACHGAVKDAAKMLIPTVAIVDTNCDPNIITYPVPGNDDTPSAVQLYCRLFKEAVLRGKNKRRQLDNLKLTQEMQNQNSEKNT